MLIYIHTAQPPSAIINHFSGRPIVTRYVSGLINGRNKNRIKLLVRSIINISRYNIIYILVVFVYSSVGSSVLQEIASISPAPSPRSVFIYYIILYQIGFQRVHWYSSTRFSQTDRHPLGVSEV